MLVELLILIFILWIYSGGFSLEVENNSPKMLSLDQEILYRLEMNLSQLFLPGEKIPKYHIIASPHRTFVTNKQRIHLVIRSPETGHFFDYETLLQVAIHELAHIMCPDKHHSKRFYYYESLFEERAVEKGLLPSQFQPDPNYPCQDES